MADTGDAPDLTFGLLEASVSFNLRRAHSAVSHSLAEDLLEVNLTHRQCAALQLIAGNEGASQIEVAASLGTDRSSMMALVDRLERRGLITRHKSANDGRRQELRLTPRGHNVVRRVNQLVRKHDRKLSERFSKNELAKLLEALKRIQRAL